MHDWNPGGLGDRSEALRFSIADHQQAGLFQKLDCGEWLLGGEYRGALGFEALYRLIAPGFTSSNQHRASGEL